MNPFPAPVSGQPIPRGWFARLVRFMNTLILHGDGSYTQVRHTNDGTFVTLTTAAIDALNRASGRPGGGSGSAQDLSASVSGSTATVGISGSTSSVELVAGANMTVSGGTNGEIVFNATSMTGMPNYFDASPQFVSVNSSAPVIVPPQAQTMWLIGTAGVNTGSNMSGTVSIDIGNLNLVLFDLTIASGSALGALTVPVSLPIPAGHSFQLSASGAGLGNFHLYPAL